MVDSSDERCDCIWNVKCLTDREYMRSSARISLSSILVPRFRAELFRVLILLVLFIITGVAVTPGASG